MVQLKPYVKPPQFRVDLALGLLVHHQDAKSDPLIAEAIECLSQVVSRNRRLVALTLAKDLLEKMGDERAKADVLDDRRFKGSYKSGSGWPLGRKRS